MTTLSDYECPSCRMPMVDGRVHHLSTCPRNARNTEAREVQQHKEYRREERRYRLKRFSPVGIWHWAQEDWEHMVVLIVVPIGVIVMAWAILL